ncbi:MAG: aminopeptidase [Candidatus Aminicenantes bacterium]|nr:aminopeptidase [Candidatus Aminicenantes bacterium]
MKKRNTLLMFALVALTVSLLTAPVAAAKDKKVEKPVYKFKTVLEVKRTPVKDQYHTGTCWCFATVAFLEAELLRLDRGEFDLSEMFVVRHTYPKKALNYVQMHGNAVHQQGGQAHDVIEQVREFGIVPEEVYSGMNIGEKRHNHGEMAAMLQGVTEAVLKRKGTRLTPRWLQAYEAILDSYLGKVPAEFNWQGRTCTPKTFASDVLGLPLDDYIELTSYDQHPFYRQCRLEIPDNWTYDRNYYNLPIDELESAVERALTDGYSVVWDGDVSEKDFSTRETGYALVPEKDWEDKTTAEREKKPTAPIEEKEITQAMRSKTLGDFSTTDDHLMHIVGLAQDQTGARFFLIKNSGGTDRKYDGYVYMSRPYFRLKTTALMVNKNSLKPELRTKLGMKP